MKKIFSFLLLLLLYTGVFAKCGSNAITPISDNTTIHKNSVIILEFYGSSQLLINELGKKHLIYLKNGDQQIMLVSQEVLKGEMQLTQVVFKPLTQPEEGSRYELVISNLKENERPTRFNPGNDKFEPIYYTFTAAAITTAPVFTMAPQEVKKTMCRYGCGPAKWVYYKIAPENKENYVRTFVKNLTTGKTTAFILAVEDNMIKVGHGMCAGAFTFDPENLYEIAFRLEDHSGNYSQQTAAVILKQPDTFTGTD